MTRALILLICIVFAAPAHAQPKRKEVANSLRQGVQFFRMHASADGGYVYRVSADLSKREGEGVVGTSTAWIEPPGTPFVGLAYLEAYQLCGDKLLLEAAKETAEALLRGQLRSGGWDNKIEFDPEARKSYAYRAEPHGGKDARNTTTFDDNKSQSAITFLMRLDQELEFQDDRLHEAVLYALNATLEAQYSNGAWPQRFSAPADPDAPSMPASLPKTWSREFPKQKYANFYTLNDGTQSDLIVMMLDAWEIYQDDQYLKAAARGGDFLLLAQLPEPQPGWAQQYDRDMHPAWARKFEPPAITGGESQGVMQVLMRLYRRTAVQLDNANRFLEPIPRALAYYRRSTLPDGRLARFYELESNRPLFFTKDYQLTFSSDDMPTHYSFIVSSKLDRIERELTKIRETPKEKLWKPRTVQAAKPSDSLNKQVAKIIQDQDSRGAWVESGQLRYHKDDQTREVIQSETFAKHIQTLASWLSANP